MWKIGCVIALFGKSGWRFARGVSETDDENEAGRAA
jgi:hypothetical protein